RLANQNIKNIYDYLKFTNIEISDLFKNFNDLLDKYDNHGISASNEINQLLTKKINELDFDNDIILKDIEAILILAKEKFDAATEVEQAKKKAEKEAKKTAQEEEKAKQAAIREAKKLALEKAKKEADEKIIKDQNEKERKSRNSIILGYFSIFIGVILCSWGLWELGSYLWDNYSTEIKWITAILLAGFIILLYLAEYKLISFLIGITCLSLWFYLGDKSDPVTIKSDNVSLFNKNSNKKSKKVNSFTILNKPSQCPNVKYRDNCFDTVFESTGKYVGEFKNHSKHGQGTYIWKDKQKYIGSWKNNKLDGQGTYFYKNGDKYFGQWVNHQMSGQGTYFYMNGDKYVGQWKNGKKHGSGILTSKNETKNGIWKNDKLQNNSLKPVKKILEKAKSQTNTDSNINNKIVTKNYNNGTYTGYFKNDKRHGKGSYIFNNGHKYVGQWKNGQQNGNGIFTYKSGTQLNGKFYNGVPSFGTEIYVDKWSGDKYIGNFKNWEREGQGTYLYKNGDKHVGQWKNGKKHGYGIFTTRNKTKKGTWENGKFMYGEADKIN
ncbi:hypothetical protein OAI36_01980, partial [Alphaproteobacteria bacterium]|nr:hypothetical protein [Alphaproteobacteria bacterium]